MADKNKKQCTTFYIEEKLRKQFKAKLASEGLTASKIINMWIKKYLESDDGKN